MKEQTLSVKAIEKGVVIDHIPAGQGLNILKHFHLDEIGECITVGFNLKGKNSDASKDLIKVENVCFSADEINRLALFAPSSTINIIDNFEVIEKYTPQLPENIKGVFDCPNQQCATHDEPVDSLFYVKPIKELIKLKCYYCEKTYPIDWVMNAK